VVIVVIPMTRFPRILATLLAAFASFADISPAAGQGAATGSSTPSNPSTEPAPRLVNDHCPVMTEEFTSPLHEIQAHGVTVRFCCSKCRRRFESDPTPYLARLPQVTPAVARAFLVESDSAAGDLSRARAERADAWLDRWMRPLLLATAALLSAWLVLRIVRRRREGSEAPPGE
jgi:YHS domain-containing protein